MPKVNILPRLRPESLRAVELSRAQNDSFRPSGDDALANMRAAYNHERAYWNSFRVELPEVLDLALDTPHGRVPLRLYRPTNTATLPVLIYAHGGGFTLGNLDTHDRICRILAQRSGWAVLAVDYALAPEKTWPVQPDQMLAVIAHVAAHGADWGLDGTRIAVGGDSAGARLTLGAALDCRAAGGPTLCALLMYYGGFGLKDSASYRLFGWSDLDGMDDEDLSQYRHAYVPRTEDRDHPRLNMLRADMAGLPPSFIGAVAYDPLRDDSLALAELMKDRGVPYRLEVYEGVLHSFLHYSAVEPLAMKALEDGAAFLRAL